MTCVPYPQLPLNISVLQVLTRKHRTTHNFRTAVLAGNETLLFPALTVEMLGGCVRSFPCILIASTFANGHMEHESFALFDSLC
jgi:hypothetical protein